MEIFNPNCDITHHMSFESHSLVSFKYKDFKILCNFPKAQHPTMPPYTYSTARRCSSGKCVMKE